MKVEGIAFFLPIIIDVFFSQSITLCKQIQDVNTSDVRHLINLEIDI